jgi:hypothetical protein
MEIKESIKSAGIVEKVKKLFIQVKKAGCQTIKSYVRKV